MVEDRYKEGEREREVIQKWWKIDIKRERERVITTWKKRKYESMGIHKSFQIFSEVVIHRRVMNKF